MSRDHTIGFTAAARIRHIFVIDGQNHLLVSYWDGPAFAAAVRIAFAMPWYHAAIAAAAHGSERVAREVVEELPAAQDGRSSARSVDP